MSKTIYLREALANASQSLSKAKAQLETGTVQGEPDFSEAIQWIATVEKQLQEIRHLCGATEEKKNVQSTRCFNEAEREFTIWAASEPGVRDRLPAE